MKKHLILFSYFIILFGVNLQFAFAQTGGEVAGEEPEPEQVIKLEELIIQLEPLKVFTILRSEADLPPIDFIGTFKEEFLSPGRKIFRLEKADFEPIIPSDLEKMLAKERK
jgi:hypothetical protein